MVIKNVSSELLIISEGGFSVRIWGIIVFIFGSAGIYVIQTSQKNLTDKIPLIMSWCFAIAGLLALIFVRHKLRYIFDKRNNMVTFIFPEIMGVTKSVRTFKLSDIDHISDKYIVTFSDNEASRLPFYESKGFVIMLKDNSAIKSNYYSSKYSEITKVVRAIADFCDVPVKNEEVKDEE